MTGERGFQIQLRSAPSNLNDPQKIIIFINAQGQGYAIPFFSNTYRDYWDFQFDKPIPNIKLTNTTFQNEFMKAMDYLNLNDTLNTVYQVLDELSISILHCTKVKESDSIDLKMIGTGGNLDLQDENRDSCDARYKNNYTAIFNEIRKKGIMWGYFARDEENDRIYQYIIDKKRFYGKSNVSIKVYRQDCIWNIPKL